MEHEEERGLSADDAVEALKYPYRRQLLIKLLEHGSEDEVVIPGELNICDEELQSMLVEMTHVHFPKPEELDVIKWDRNENVVTRGPWFHELQPLLKLVDDHRSEFPNGATRTGSRRLKLDAHSADSIELRCGISFIGSSEKQSR